MVSSFLYGEVIMYDRFEPIILTFPYGSISEGLDVTIVNDKVYVNGYEYIHGTWKRTLKALWYRIF